MSEPLSSFADIHYGRSPADVFAEEGEVPVYGTGGAYGKASESLFSGPAVIIPRKGSLSSPHFSEGPFWASDTTYAAIPKRGVNAQWLYYQLCQFNLESLNEATGVPSISRDWLAKSGLFPHDTDSQIVIARVLRAIDAQIEATEALIAKQERVRTGLMQDLFTRGVDGHGQLRPPRQEAPHLYRQTELGWLPQGWDLEELAALVRVIDCKHYTPRYVEEGYPVVRPRNVKPDGLDLVNVGYVSESDFRAMTDIYRPKRGDIILSRNASYGVSSRVETDIEFAIGQDVIVMTAKKYDLGYVFHALQSDSIVQQITKVSSGSTFGRINLGEIKKLRVPVAQPDERDIITKSLDRMSEFQSALVGELNLLLHQKAGLMQDLLTGKVSVAPLLEGAAA